MNLALIFFTRKGGETAVKLARGLAAAGHEAALFGPERFAAEAGGRPYGQLDRWTAEQFSSRDGLIFVSACGIAVRAAAPYVRDKLTDPAVVSVDENGTFAVPLLSGHVGGANDLARLTAELSGGTAVISTATDVNGRFAVDQWAARQGMTFDRRELAKAVSAALLDGRTVGFASDYPVEGALPEGLSPAETEGLGIYVTRSGTDAPFAATLRLWPRVLHLGVGCRRGTPPEKVSAAVDAVLAEHRLAPAAVKDVSSIDLKRDEDALRVLSRERSWPLRFYTAEELLAVEGDFTPSAFVRSVTGVDNVCERAAVRSGGGGPLLVRKTARDGVTVAAAEERWSVRF